MKEEPEYFPYAFKACPYCKSKNIVEPNLDDKTLRIMGAHAYASITCNDCKRKWETSNQTQINWQVPPKRKGR